jgi:hypothetical protein
MNMKNEIKNESAPAPAGGHTPGPYLARQESPGTFTVEKSDGELRSILCRLHVEHLCLEHGGTIEANALLFASAPALLAERDRLRAFLKIIADGKQGPHCTLLSAGQMMEYAKAALAEGGKS